MKKFLTFGVLCAITVCALLTVSCKEEQYSVTVTNNGNGTGTATPSAAEQGTLITLTAIPDYGYYFEKWTVVSGSVVLDRETANSSTFTMPAENVEIKAEFVIDPDKVEYTIEVTSDGNGEASASAETAVLGTEITLTAIPAIGYDFSQWTVISGVVELDDATVSQTTFTMPAENIEVKAEFIEVNGFDLIVDPIFKEYCQQFDTNGDGFLSREESMAVIEIRVNSMQIQSLDGIEIFINLTNLGCWDNYITTLDVSNNTYLTELVCYMNTLTSLDVSDNHLLTRFDCSANQLISLDVSNNIVLDYMDCSSNNLTSLNVEGAIALTTLHCSNNSLSTLIVSENIILKDLHCGENNLVNLDVSGAVDLRYLSCRNNNLLGNALREIFSALPMRDATDYAIVYYGDNSGSQDITANDVKIAEDKNWTVYW